MTVASMKRRMDRLEARATRKDAKPRMTDQSVYVAGLGSHADGAGLILKVHGESASWVFRYTAPSGKRRDMGLGVVLRTSVDQAGESLAAAREAAHKAREALKQGLDPLKEREKLDTRAKTLPVWVKTPKTEFDIDAFAYAMADAAYRAVKAAASEYSQ